VTALAWTVALLLFGVATYLWVEYRKTQQSVKDVEADNATLVERLTEAEQELSNVKARRKKLLSAATQALIIVEKDFLVSSANKVARQLFGKPGRTNTLMGWTRQHQLQDLVESTLEGERMPTVFINIQDKTLEANARAIKENEEVVAVALALHDITRVVQLSRARRDFVANISHELRTPLASIQLLADTLLADGLHDRDMSLDLLTKLATQVDSLSQLAQEVLDLSMIESGKVPVKMSTWTLRDILGKQIERHLPQAERKNLTVTLDVEDSLTVLVDDRLFGRVVSNLLHNAIKFTENGTVTISAQKLNGRQPEQQHGEGEWVCVTVSDTGVGLAPEEIPRIFERFYKVDRARNRQEAGTGLGLAIARHIVEAHGGVIWAEPSHPGASFHFTMPTE
jgi:two-component system phosphate regulon sensor histidine kinase PhoR